MKLRAHQRVSLLVAKERAIEALDDRHPRNAATIAAAIWPDHEMTAQGAGAAASRILKVLEKEGLARWSCSLVGNHYVWGWSKVMKTH